MEKTVSMLPEDYQFNLSDFALFLSVMKNPRAYRNVLSIIMDEPDIEIKEVKVEQVILNKSGKRAIRLDAWARSTDERQFNMEMQNDTKGDEKIFLEKVLQSTHLQNNVKISHCPHPSPTTISLQSNRINLTSTLYLPLFFAIV